MEICGKAPMMNEEPTNVVYLSSLLNKQEDVIAHKCDRRCDIEHVWANIYRCKLTGSTHICDKNCNQKIVYDNYSCICRVSHQVFPLTAAEQQAVRGVVRQPVTASAGHTPHVKGQTPRRLRRIPVGAPDEMVGQHRRGRVAGRGEVVAERGTARGWEQSRENSPPALVRGSRT